VKSSKGSDFRLASRERGFTLVEALVALLCLSIGLLGIAALQLTGLRANLGAGWRSQATYLSYDIVDRMRANRTALNSYNVGYGAAPGGASTSDRDLQAWKTNLTTLPAGDGMVVVDAINSLVTVTLKWNDRKGDRSETGGDVEFVTQSRL
jgi:type IV pilus assembly protein PilV